MELDLIKSYTAVKKQLLRIALFIVVICAAVGFLSKFYVQPVYEASTKLLVTKLDGLNVNPLDINTVNLNIKLIDTYKEIIRTPAIMNEVVREYPDLQLTTAQLITMVKVSSINETPVMSVVVQDVSYDRAAKIVNAVSIVFQKQIPQIMKVDNVTILNEAKVVDSPKPVKPNVQVNVIIAFIVSLLLAVCYVVIKDYLDDYINTEEDIAKHLHIPTFGMIPKVSGKYIKKTDWNAEQKKVGEMSNVTVN